MNDIDAHWDGSGAWSPRLWRWVRRAWPCFWAAAAWLASPTFAAPSDCLGTAADGGLRCTAPLISQPVYSICIQTAYAYPDDALQRCRTRYVGAGGVIRTQKQAAAIISCTVREVYPTAAPPAVTFGWAGAGQTFIDNNLCSAAAARHKYGMEINTWAHHTAQQLGFGWGVLTRRDRKVECPRGFSPVGADAQLPDYCIKPANMTCCDDVGNPLAIATAEKKLFETDFATVGALPLRFTRAYSNFGHYRPVNAASDRIAGMGDFWRHAWSHRLWREPAGGHLWVTVQRPNGSDKHFRADGREVLNIDGRLGDTLAVHGGGWLYRDAAGGRLETYDGGGRLTRIADRTGPSHWLTYSDASTPGSIAPFPGLLTRVADSFGRSVEMTYDDLGRLLSVRDPAGGVYRYSYDTNDMLVQVDQPDGTARRYSYDEPQPFASRGGPYAISGVFDENGARAATYRYGDPYWNTPDTTERGNGADRYTRQAGTAVAGGLVIPVVDALGTTRRYTVMWVNNVLRVVHSTQPSGSGSAASSTSNSFDKAGNLLARDDARGTRTCRQFDPVTNLETTRTEGLASGADCAAALPAGARRISTSWHPDWPLPVDIAEPRRRTVYVYNGQPDPTAGGAIAGCSTANALLPDGKPIAVLCRRIEQATTDVDGSLGFAAAPEAGVNVRSWRWTYDGDGRMRTAVDPLGNTTTYTYHATTTADYVRGDLASTTDASGARTQYTRYDRTGRVLRSIDPNGVITDYTYDARQRLTSVTVGGLRTTHEYWPTGQPSRTTDPAGNWTLREYDAAGRLVRISDHLGNAEYYTLDGKGHRIVEQLTDAAGVVRRRVDRAIDALGRVRQVSGRE